MLPFGVFQLIFGPLADRYGKKHVITLSIIMFTIASGLCALGTGLTDLAVYRALTGTFAASVMPMSPVATCFMGGGGIGTAIGARSVARYRLESLSIVYGAALIFTLLISFALIRDKVVEDDECEEEIGNL